MAGRGGFAVTVSPFRQVMPGTFSSGNPCSQVENAHQEIHEPHAGHQDRKLRPEIVAENVDRSAFYTHHGHVACHHGAVIALRVEIKNGGEPEKGW